MEGMATYTLNVPTSKARIFRTLAKEFGGTMVRAKKKSGLELAQEDIDCGRLNTYSSPDELLYIVSRQAGKHVRKI